MITRTGTPWASMRLSLARNTYSHVVPALQREAADRMEAVGEVH